MNEPIYYQPAHEIARLIRQGQTSAVEVLQIYLTRIQAFNPSLNAITRLDEDEAYLQAQKADSALGQGQIKGPLHGVPFTLKELPEPPAMSPMVSGGCPPYDREDSEEQSTVARRLQEAGGVMMGRSNAEYFPYNISGCANNPWDLARCSGQSSSGAAAALAAGLTPLEVGSDTLGSVLGPAHFCGVCGLRPTQNRVSAAGLPIVGPSLLFQQFTVFGPMARCVADIAMVMAIIAGPDKIDFDVPPVPWRRLARPAIESLRLAWSLEIPGAAIDGEIREAIENLAKKSAHLGIKVERRLPDVDYTNQAGLYRRLFHDLMLDACYLPSSREGLEIETNPMRSYLSTLAERRRLVAQWEDFFEQWDALLLPACGVAAQPHGQPEVGDSVPCDAGLPESSSLPLRLAPATGHPALVFPIGHDHQGLPIGGLLIGRLWGDEELLAFGEILADVAGGCGHPAGYSGEMT